MKKIIFALIAFTVALPAGAIDRKTGNPRSLYIEKGTVSVSLLGGYNTIGTAGLSDGSNYSLLGIVDNLKGNGSIYDINFAASWFFVSNASLVARVGYSGLDLDLDSSTVLNQEIENKHLTRPMLTFSVGARYYMPLFNSRTFALFCEGRVNGALGSSKTYSVTERGKEGQFNDISSVSLGLYPGVSFFVTNQVAVELSLPLLEGGYLWETQYHGQEAAAKAHHGFVNFKPALLQSRIGIVFHF